MKDPTPTWSLARASLDVTNGVLMGVVNVTPDSFSDGDLYLDPRRAIDHGLQLVSDGATLVDVGGESTRPGSSGVTPAEELARVMPVVEGLVDQGVIVSIDTSKPEVASAAIDAGAEVVNDVNGLRADGMVDVVAEASCGVVLMHMQGTPRVMQADPTYEDVVGEVESFLTERAGDLAVAGVDRSRIAIDPGIGFGKTLEHNLSLLHHLDRFASHGYPVVLGTSRKSFLGALTSIEVPADRDAATAVTTALAYAHGARIFRVHNVVLSRHAIELTSAIVAAD